jgi:hypothetical protein
MVPKVITLLQLKGTKKKVYFEQIYYCRERNQNIQKSAGTYTDYKYNVSSETALHNQTTCD